VRAEDGFGRLNAARIGDVVGAEVAQDHVDRAVVQEQPAAAAMHLAHLADDDLQPEPAHHLLEGADQVQELGQPTVGLDQADHGVGPAGDRLGHLAQRPGDLLPGVHIPEPVLPRELAKGVHRQQQAADLGPVRTAQRTVDVVLEELERRTVVVEVGAPVQVRTLGGSGDHRSRLRGDAQGRPVTPEVSAEQPVRKRGQQVEQVDEIVNARADRGLVDEQRSG
jgi:hypothetical protein